MFKGDNASNLAAAAPIHSMEELLRQLDALKKERAFLDDEILVKNQVIVAMSNALQASKSELSTSKSELKEKLESLKNANVDVGHLRQQVSSSGSKSTQFEKKIQNLEEELKTWKEKCSEMQGKLDSVAAQDAELNELREQSESHESQMADWKSKVKEALKENRKKEQHMQATEIELRTKLSLLQAESDKANFELQALQAKTNRPRTTVEVQTELDLFRAYVVSSITPEEVHTALEKLTPPGVPLRQMTSPNARDPLASSNGAVMSPVGRSARDSHGRGPLSPPILTADSPPMIVTIHFGTSEGWTVDSKHFVKPEMKVLDLIKECCDQINGRYDLNLTPDMMCIKIHHGKAKRSVVLPDEREIHSFLYFHKCLKEGKQIVLSFERRMELQEHVHALLNSGGVETQRPQSPHAFTDI